MHSSYSDKLSCTKLLRHGEAIFCCNMQFAEYVVPFTYIFKFASPKNSSNGSLLLRLAKMCKYPSFENFDLTLLLKRYSAIYVIGYT